MKHCLQRIVISTTGLLAAIFFVAPATAREHSEDIGINVLSGQPDRVSGGSTLVEITFSRHERRLVVTLNGHDVSSSFRPGEKPNSMVGLMTGLVLGRNRLRVREEKAERQSN